MGGEKNDEVRKLGRRIPHKRTKHSVRSFFNVFVFYVVCFRLIRMVPKLKLSSSMTDGILKLPVKCCRKRQVLERNCEIQTFETGSCRRSKLRISKCRNCESEIFQTLVGLLLIFGECLYFSCFTCIGVLQCVFLRECRRAEMIN